MVFQVDGTGKGTTDGTYPNRLPANAGVCTGNDDDLAREIGDVLRIEGLCEREGLTEPCLKCMHDDDRGCTFPDAYKLRSQLKLRPKYIE